MSIVMLNVLVQGGKELITMTFTSSPIINQCIRKCPGINWDQSGKFWCLPLSRENYRRLLSVLNNIASIDNTGLKQYLLFKRQKENFPTTQPVPATDIYSRGLSKTNVQHGETTSSVENSGIHPVNSQVLITMEQLLKLKAYSKSTIKTYLNEMGQLLKALQSVPADDLNENHIKRYLVYCYEKLELSENTLHSRINAMKFYYEQVLHRSKFFWDIPRPKRPIQLPKLLNEVELARLFNAMQNKKHKAMLFTAYSAGLRVSEIVKLKIADIDSTRMQIFIGKAKGKKDRYVNLSPVLLDILRQYIKSYQPRPKTFLFESEQTLTAYPVRTVQQIFSNAKRKAGILKEVGVHSLRHSFATHLLDKGTDIKYIKDLLGHFNIKTTERYLHVSKKQLVNVISPFDDLWRSQEINW